MLALAKCLDCTQKYQKLNKNLSKGFSLMAIRVAKQKSSFDHNDTNTRKAKVSIKML